MATLVSPGVSVSVINESFFFPVVAPTLPVFFIATRAGKTQVDGVTPAAGTLEHDIVRTVTSISQSLELYGVPYFRNDASGNEFHGDARNEYGLLALNQFLGTGNRAYVIRAGIDLDDEVPESFISLGTPSLVGAVTYSASNVGNSTLASITCAGTYVKPQIFTVTFTGPSTFSVRGSISGYEGAGTVGIAFTSNRVNFTVTAGSTSNAAGDVITFSVGYHATFTGTTLTHVTAGAGQPSSLVADTLAVAEVWTIAMTSATAFSVTGSVSGVQATGTVGAPYDNNRINFILNAGTIPFVAGDTFTVTATTTTVVDPLGANDAARRVAITTALQATVNSNVDVRSPLYEFNLCACPGYWELADELTALCVDVKEEAIVIADTPCDKTPDQIATWSLTSDRVRNNLTAYYYPWCLTSNLDGRNVLGAPSGTVLRTIAYSDQQSYVWMAPAGANRGIVTGASKVGYVTGTLGAATTFVEANLNDGQRDNLYEYDKNLNPIVFFPGRGILIWGQKTSAPVASAMDRVNVVRLVAYLRRMLRKGAVPFVFEPNDQITRDNLKSAADGMLADVLSKRGLYDFATLCDGTNNTATRIDRNELWLDVAIKPVKAAEFIYIPIRVVSTGADI
jgi:phage tail sheath protein FI